jgi:hypothetical protein
MARRRKASFMKARTRTIVQKSSKKRSSKGMNLGFSNTPLRPYAIGYGIVRTKLASILDPVTSKIPAGEFADELGIGVLSWFIGKKFPKMKPFANTALEIENYRVGELFAGRMGNNVKTTSTEW